MRDHQHFKVYKPYGYLSQFTNNQNTRRNKKLLGELYDDFPEGTMAIGRLDQDSEGLLLLTTDGKTSEEVRSKRIQKEYYAQVDGLIDEARITQIRSGVEIRINGKKYLTSPCEASQLDNPPDFPERTKKLRDERHGPTSWISITLTEGKFRQVRKMTAAVGFPTLRLVRVRVGEERLGKMQPGEVKPVKQFNLDQRILP